MNWSTQQEAIFGWFSDEIGNLLVRARAGTGKTTTIIEGIGRAPESKILLAAFNKEIAEELARKVKNPRAEVKTLHSLGFAYVRRNWSGVRVDMERGGRLAMAAAGGTDAPPSMIGMVAKLAGLAKSIYPTGATHDTLVALARDFDLEPDAEWKRISWDVDRVARCAAKAVVASTVPDGTVDFDDMIFVPIANGWIQGWFDLVVVDEAQDMNAAQLILAQGACKETGRIAVVGDDRQAIYGFRGADSGALDRLKCELNAKELGLTITRRCPQVVVAEAAKLVPDFESAPDAPMGRWSLEFEPQLPELVHEGDFVISRKNAPLASMCLKILRVGKRARIQGRDIGAGLVALVKKIAKGRGRDSMPEFLERLLAWEGKEVARWRAAGKEAKALEQQDKAETLRVMSEGLTGVPELCNRIESLFADNVKHLPCVMLSSVHRSKGLEAANVYVLGDTLYVGGPKAKEDIEEQNLHYVAITRAKEHLIWVSKPVPPAPAPAAPAEKVA